MLTTQDSALAEQEICARLQVSDIEVTGIDLLMEKGFRKYTFNVREGGRPVGNAVPRIIEELGNRPGVAALEWRRFN